MDVFKTDRMKNNGNEGIIIEMESLQTLQSDLSQYLDTASPYIDWLGQNWILLVLSGEVIGAVIAIKVGRYRRGLAWLVAALATIWLGAFR